MKPTGITTASYETIAFSHAFQPIVDIASARTIAYEVLVRGPNGEPPYFVFDQLDPEQLIAFDQFSREKAIGTAAHLGVECALNLNFTPEAIVSENGHYIQTTLDKAAGQGFAQRQIVIEITESEIIRDTALFQSILNDFRRKNTPIAIDDFGSGYAGLNALAEIMPDMIKLDMELIRGIDGNGPRQSIVRAICGVCFDLGIDILAEGVETEAEFTFLRHQGITLYQGFLFAKPGFEILPKIFIPQ